MPKTVGIAVSNATFHFDKLYTYAVLPEHQNVVRLGSMVWYPSARVAAPAWVWYWPAMPSRSTPS